MRFEVITLFPQIIQSYVSQSILGKASLGEKISVNTHDLREFGVGRYKQVDDRPFGGGAGMVLMFRPIANALESIFMELAEDGIPRGATEVVATTAGGERYAQSVANSYRDRFMQEDGLRAMIILCGRYEGFDQRILTNLVDREISLGNFVLTGGELPALVMIDSISRLQPGVLGNAESFAHDSFYEDDQTAQYPQYTRPDKIQYKGVDLCVPEVLKSGDHAKIEDWREQNRLLTVDSVGGDSV